MSIAPDEVLIQAIDHQIRREILQLLHDSSKSFTDILNHFDIATSKLNYHLKLLEGFLQKTSEGKYELTALGHRAYNIMELIRKEMSNVNQVDQPLVKDAYIAQKQSKNNILTDFIEIGIVGVCFVIVFMLIMFIAMLFDKTTPLALYFITPGIAIAFLFFLKHLLDMKKSATGFVQRIEEHLANEIKK